MAEPNERASTVNSKIHSDSGYGSNKSNSQSQRSSGSSKSQHSSLSSGSGKGYPPHPNAPVSNADCQAHATGSPGPGSVNSTKRQSKKKCKLDRKPSSVEKNELRTLQLQDTQIKDGSKGNGGTSQSMDYGGTSSMPNAPQPQSQMSPASKASSTHDSKALQVAALTHVLSCMKKFQDPITESELNDESDDCVRPNKIHWQDHFSENFKEASNEDNFAAVVSLDDGMVVYMTPATGNILGFPKDMLLGRSFVDFVHPKDRMAFASHITCGINFPIGDQSQSIQGVQGPTVKSEPFYCRLRQYRGLKTVGFGVIDKTVVHYPFKLTMQLKKVEAPYEPNVAADKSSGISSDSFSKSETSSMKETSGTINKDIGSSAHNSVYLVIGATRIKSAYQYPEEIPKHPGKFVTRHSASCHFGHMDSDAISYLGHLPQDLIGNSVLDYYHPEDMTSLKEIYEAVMQEQGKPFRSKPYRFRVFNGTFATLETDWSCFINPWSWKLEFVIGQHRVIQGPMNPNVFMQPKVSEDELLKLPEDVLADGREMQDEIRKMLTETVTRRLSDPLRQQSSRRRKDLAALMETLLEQMAKTENSDKSGSQCSGFSVMERDSVMLGEISPHHDDNSGSNQSSSTPPSYNQLNYRENIERFFQSKPKTARSDESAESSSKMDTQNNRSSDSDSKSSPIIDYSSSSYIRYSSGSNESGNERVGSSGNFGSGSLTQALLTRHNEDMEKNMIQRHRESRGKSSMTPGSHKESRHRHSENVPYAYPVASSRSLDDSSDILRYCRAQRSKKNLHKCDAAHGLKRTGNGSWDGNSHHAKQPHLDFQSTSNSNSVAASNSNIVESNIPLEFATSNSIKLWPPFSISMTPGITTPSYRYTYPSYVFTNPSSAGHVGNSTPGGVSITPGYHYNIDPSGGKQQMSMIPPAYNPNGVATVPATPTSSNLIVEQTMNNPNAGTPLIFLGQQQFLPQQVQLMPAGVVYQPMTSQMFGQHPQFLMPMGTMIHPGQSMFMATQPGMSQISGQTSSGVFPPTSINMMTIPTPPVSLSEQRISKPTSISLSASGISSIASSTIMTKVTSTFTRPAVAISRAKGKFTNITNEVASAGSATMTFLKPSSSRNTKGNSSGPGEDISMISCSESSSGSGSDESMNASSINTKDSKESMDQDQCNSDQSMGWDNQSENLRECQKSLKNVRNKEPPWLEKVAMTSDLAYRYTLPEKDLSDVLRKDLEALKIIGKQSPLVNDQLSMLYNDLTTVDEDNTKSSSSELYLDDGMSSSSGEELPGPSNEKEPKKLKKKLNVHQYNRMVLTYEENAPFPPEEFYKKKVFLKPAPVAPRHPTTSSKIANAATVVS